MILLDEFTGVTVVFTPGVFEVAGRIIAAGPSGLVFLAPVPLKIGLNAALVSKYFGRRDLGEFWGRAGSHRRVEHNGKQFILHKQVGDSFKPVGPSQMVRPTDGNSPYVRALISGFSVYVPIYTEYPVVSAEGYKKEATSYGIEMYIGLAVGVALMLLSWLALILPAFQKPPPPVPPQSREAAPPPPVPVPAQQPPSTRPPPAPRSPVMMAVSPPALPIPSMSVAPPENRPYTHSSTAPIKHFGGALDASAGGTLGFAEPWI
jgi:hypothetical protein